MGIRELGYLIFSSPDLAGWESLGEDIFGMSASKTAQGALYLKMDDRDYRIAIVEGSEDRLLASGWEVTGKPEFDSLRQRLVDAGVAVSDGSPDERQLRRVQEFFSCDDPSGNRLEIYWGSVSSFTPFKSPRGVSSFVTEGLGLGHVVLPALQLEESQKFLTELLGFELSDILTMDFGGHEVKIYFNHCDNGRQHSLALARMPSPNGCVHFMVEVPTMKDLGLALDRVQDAGLQMMMTLGQHVNDDCISFYFRSNSGFMMEIGWESVIKDWERHSVFETTLPSHWGHRFVGHD